MRKKHHILLVAVFAMAIIACMGSTSEARMIRVGSMTTTRVLKPGAKTYSGEPDVGGSRSHSDGGGIAVPTPNGFIYIMPAWVTRYLGVGW